MMEDEILVAQIKQDEGVVRGYGGRHIPYSDHLGYMTIGYGTLIDPERGGGLYDEEAEFILRNRLRKVRTALHNNIYFFEELSTKRKRALINMAFQMGVTGVLGFKKMLGAMQAGKWGAAHEEALDSKWAKQTPERAERVARMILEG